MEQFEQLLTCAICLDRYRNPKLLPCQHSFCMEPCMDGLVDYVRRQVKCPECRAEHRIPYQGVQGFPTNVTLQRFLELHIEITGELPDPTSGQIMERCNVCSEKAYCSICVHCEKKICSDCKGAHMDILRREISRINNQVRRALHRLDDSLSLVTKNMLSLQQNCTSVSEEVDEIYRRLNKALKDRTEFLRGEIDRYMTTELRNLSTLKENLELEISNIHSNCDLADKHMTDAVEWDDCELMDAKEIFLKTVEFIRNFEYENTDYNRRVRFSMSTDPNQLVLHVAGYGELSINMPHQPFITSGGSIAPGGSSGGLLQPPGMGGGGPGLMRSKSDHRLASQFRQQQEGYEGDPPSGRVSPLGGRKFGERYPRGDRGGGYDQPSSRYGRGGGDYSGEFESPYDNEGSNRPRKYRSRLSARHLGGEGDSDNDAPRSVRFSAEHATHHHKERERVLDTEDVARGPLSGITRLYDSPRVMKRLQESEQRDKKKEKEPVPAPIPQFKPLTPQPQLQQQAKRGAQRQVSEEDEISKIKRANKTTTSTSSTEAASAERPVAERVAALKSRDASSGEDRDSSQPASPTGRTPPSETPARKASATEVASSDAESDEDSPVASLPQRKTTATSGTGSKTSSRRSSTSSDQTPAAHAKATRSASSDSTTSTESSTTATTGATTATPTTPPAPASTGTTTSHTRVSTNGSETTTKKPFQSRFLANRQQQPAEKVTKKEEEEDEEESEESSSESEETDSEEESAEEKKTTTESTPASSVAAPATSTTKSPLDRTDVGALLARSAQARDTAEQARRNSRDDTSTTKPAASRYDSSYTSRYGTAKDRTNEESNTPRSYGYTSRFLNKSKSSAAVSPDEAEDSSGGRGSKYSSTRTATSTATEEDSKYPSGRSRYAALKDRRSRLARSRSSHNFGGPDDDEEERSTSPTSNMPSSYLASRYGPGSSSTTSATGSGTTGNDLARSRSTHALKTSSPDRTASSAAGGGNTAGGSGGSEKDGAALSSWARYLKNKYGNKAGGKEGHGAGASAGSSSSSATAARRLSLGLPLRHTNSVESSDDDQKNPGGSPTSPTAATAAAAAAAAGFAVAAGSSPRSQYLQKRRQQFKIGSRGSEPGCFTWPRGIAVGPDNSIVVADSSNHRVQVFDANGIFVKEFGSYGNAEGEFDCLAGVAVNRIGQFIIADRYNHRIQVMDPQGRFLRAFGSQGTADGRFNYPWGITTDALGFIYVCDKENHRVQVFQSDGTFVGKFGSCGSKPGQLEHPHYIAVSSTNRVIVSDSNNHRIQIFDVNGRVLTTFGSEGSEEGQFKFPRGVAVDDQGYIFVADSGNNRIQIFHPDGTFLRAFGCWGSGDGEFKGLEGIAVMSNGNILVCDRENHRIQVF